MSSAHLLNPIKFYAEVLTTIIEVQRFSNSSSNMNTAHTSKHPKSNKIILRYIETTWCILYQTLRPINMKCQSLICPIRSTIVALTMITHLRWNPLCLRLRTSRVSSSVRRAPCTRSWQSVSRSSAEKWAIKSIRKRLGVGKTSMTQSLSRDSQALYRVLD